MSDDVEQADREVAVVTVRERLRLTEHQLSLLHERLSVAQRQLVLAEDTSLPQAEAQLNTARQALGERLEAGAPPAEIARLASRERDLASRFDSLLALHRQRQAATERLRAHIDVQAARRVALLADISNLETAAQAIDQDLGQLGKRAADAEHDLAALLHKIRGRRAELDAVRRELGLPPSDP